jgi:hypothetical protein
MFWYFIFLLLFNRRTDTFFGCNEHRDPSVFLGFLGLFSEKLQGIFYLFRRL